MQPVNTCGGGGGGRVGGERGTEKKGGREELVHRIMQLLGAVGVYPVQPEALEQDSSYGRDQRAEENNE